jgi:hypothetical protein
MLGVGGQESDDGTRPSSAQRAQTDRAMQGMAAEEESATRAVKTSRAVPASADCSDGDEVTR